MAGLNESAMALYNDFNRQDRDEDVSVSSVPSVFAEG
jgi:hypothetical protein